MLPGAQMVLVLAVSKTSGALWRSQAFRAVSSFEKLGLSWSTLQACELNKKTKEQLFC